MEFFFHGQFFALLFLFDQHWQDHWSSFGSWVQEVLQIFNDRLSDFAVLWFFILGHFGLQDVVNVLLRSVDQVLGFAHVDKAPAQDVRSGQNALVLVVNRGYGNYQTFFRQDLPVADNHVANVGCTWSINEDVLDVEVTSDSSTFWTEADYFTIFQDKLIKK